MIRFQILNADPLPDLANLIKRSTRSASSKKMVSAHKVIERALARLSEREGPKLAFTRLFETLYCSGSNPAKRAQVQELIEVKITETQRTYFFNLVYLIAAHAVQKQSAVFSTRDEVRPPTKVSAEFQNIALWEELTESFKLSHALIWHDTNKNQFWSDVGAEFYEYCKNSGRRYKWAKHVLRSFTRLCFYTGVGDIKNIDGSLINWFQNNDYCKSERSFGFIPDFLYLNGANCALDAPDDSYDPKIPWLDVGANPNSPKDESAQKEFVFNGQTYVEDNYSLAWAGREGTRVFRRPLRKEKIFGGWVFDGPASKYSCNYLIEDHPNSIWLLAEQDYVKSHRETSTRKHRNSHLSIFNTYLFGYLPYAIDQCNIDKIFWPEAPSDFHSAIFVGRSRLIMNQLGISVKSQMPLTIVQFLDIYYNVGDGQSNAPRDCMSTISQFFDFVSAKLSEHPGCRLDSNPITLTDKRAFRGYGYKTSRKKVPEFEYWLLFREFVYVLAEAMIDNIHTPKHKTKCGTVIVDRDIEFADYKIRVGTIDVSDFSMPFLVEGIYGAMPLYSDNPRNVIIAMMMSFSGLRFSNVLWLDATTYELADNVIDGYQNIHVNTDKAKVGPFESMLPDKVMALVRRYSAARSKMPSGYFEPVFYQDNPDSKWGAIQNPLFDRPTQHWNTGIGLSGLIAAFEDQTPTSYELGSELVFSPEFMPFSTFNKRVNNGLGLTEAVRYIENGEHNPIEFTPIRQRSLVTAHSLRTTLDSYMSLLLPAKVIGQLFTGQTEETVRYYIKVTPAMEQRIRSYKDKGFLDFAPEALLRVREIERDEDETVRALKEHGLAAINGIIVSRTKDSQDDLDRLIGLANPKDIAVNRTHICPHGNECPPEILEKIKNKNCGICPHAISCVSDAPAIAATIRDLGDRVQEINRILDAREITCREREELMKERVRCVNSMAGWVIRQQLIDQQIDRGHGFFTSIEGQKKVRKKFMGMKVADHNEQLIARILEVEKVPTLHSKKIILQAERLARRLSVSIKDGSFNFKQLNEVDLASSLIDKAAKLHGFSASAIVNGNSELEQLEHING